MFTMRQKILLSMSLVELLQSNLSPSNPCTRNMASRSQIKTNSKGFIQVHLLSSRGQATLPCMPTDPERQIHLSFLRVVK